MSEGSFQPLRAAIIGTGYVGLTTGVCLAYLGHRFTCVDVDRGTIHERALTRRAEGAKQLPNGEALSKTMRKRKRRALTLSTRRWNKC